MDRPQETLGLLNGFIAELGGRNENEAETRHKIIDLVLHGVLSWPRNRVANEEFIRPGYADYVLKKANGDHLLFVEAKQSGVFFCSKAAGRCRPLLASSERESTFAGCHLEADRRLSTNYRHSWEAEPR